jgi:hypothetical protein
MEWVVGIVIIFGVLYFIGSIGGSSSTKKSKVITVKGFIEEGKVYTEQEAIETIANFLEALGHDNYEESSKQFPHLIRRLKKNYSEEIKTYKKGIEGHEEHFDKQTFDDEEDRKEFRKDTDLEVKQCEKCVRWFEKQITSLDENPTLVMKKVMQEHKTGGAVRMMEMEHELTKELPDSYY